MMNWTMPKIGARCHHSVTQAHPPSAAKPYFSTLRIRTLGMAAILLGSLFGALPVSAQTGQGVLDPVKTYINPTTGLVCGSCTITTSVTGTATPLSTFSDAGLTTPNANPFTLSASGQGTFFLTPGLTYRFVLKDSGGSTLSTTDSIAGLNAADADRVRLRSHSVTLSGDAFTAIYSQYAVDTEGAAAADNLSTITASTGVSTGFLMVITPANISRVVTVKHGTGNIRLGAGDYALDAAGKSILLYYDGSNWVEVSRSGGGGTVVVASTATGTQNNWAPGLSGDTIIYWAGASNLTVTGIANGISGQRVTFVNTGANVGLFSHNSGSSTAANRLSNNATSLDTPVAAGGSLTYQYDGAASLWRLVEHEQGSAAAYTVTWGNAGTANAIGNGTLTGLYWLKGKRITYLISLTFGTTTTSGSSTWTFTVPGTVTTDATVGNIQMLDTATARYHGMSVVSGGSTVLPFADNGTAGGAVQGVSGTVPFAFGNTDAIFLSGEVTVT